MKSFIFIWNIYLLGKSVMNEEELFELKEKCLPKYLKHDI